MAVHKHDKTVRTIMALVIVLVAFGLLMLFVNNRDAIIASGNFQMFMTLATAAGGLLIGLLFLVNKSHAKVSVFSKKKKRSR